MNTPTQDAGAAFDSVAAAASKLPKYRCHKTVRALKIEKIEWEFAPSQGIQSGPGVMHFCEEGFAPIPFDIDFKARNPKLSVGGYYVVYEDGYTSFSPAKAFEEGYLRVEPMLPPGVTSAKATAEPIETEIQAKGLTAPRITPADIEANIESEWYINAADGVPANDGFHPPVGARNPLRLLTFCVLVLRNGFTVTGESACVSPENFDADIGRKVARQNAVAKIWPLMGYALKEKLAQVEGTAPR